MPTNKNKRSKRVKSRKYKGGANERNECEINDELKNNTTIQNASSECFNAYDVWVNATSGGQGAPTNKQFTPPHLFLVPELLKYELTESNNKYYYAKSF